MREPVVQPGPLWAGFANDETELDRAYRVIKTQRHRRRQDEAMTPEFTFERWECINDGTESHDGRDPEDPAARRCHRCVALYAGPDPEVQLIDGDAGVR